MKTLLRITLVASLVVIGLLGTTGVAFADPPEEKVNGFVCPVWNPDSQAGNMNPNAHLINGGTTIIPGENTGTPRAQHLSIPDHATNQNGAGHPSIAGFAGPGDPGYTAIWEDNP